MYSIFWGLLTVFLVRKVNPKIDRLINKIKEKVSIKVLKAIVLIITIFLLVDCMPTCFAQDAFIVRLAKINNIQMENQEEIDEKYKKYYDNEFIANMIYTLWDDEKMIRTFPNIKINDIDGNVIYLDSLLPEIQPYYMKIFDKKSS